MKIAVVADPYWPIPPTKYGGTERIIALLIQGLIEQRHQVTLFGPGNSSTKAELIPTTPINVNSDIPGVSTQAIEKAVENTQVLVKKYQGQFDIINWHAAINPSIQTLTTPVVISLHNPYPRIIKDNPEAQEILKNTPCVTPSASYQSRYPGPKYIGVVPHGLPTDFFTLGFEKKDELLFIGRFSSEKNPHLAIKAAIELGLPITIAAKYESSDKEYFETECKPLLKHPLVNFVGEVNDDEKKILYQKCKVNLHPLSVEETFGLTILEAGLCGTPTIAFDRGSMRELIVDNTNGFIVNTLEELIQKIPLALKLHAETVRNSYLKYS